MMKVEEEEEEGPSECRKANRRISNKKPQNDEGGAF